MARRSYHLAAVTTGLTFLLILLVAVVPLALRYYQDSREYELQNLASKLEFFAERGASGVDVDTIRTLTRPEHKQTPAYQNLLGTLRRIEQEFDVDNAVVMRRQADGQYSFVAIGHDELQGDVDEALDRLTDHVDHVLDLLDRPDTGVFGALASTLSTNYARELNAIRRIEVRYSDQLSEGAVAALDNITRRVKDVDIARQYFKTMYIQEELSYFSRLLLYVGIPAEFLTVAALIAMSQSGSTLSGLPLTLPLLAPVIVTVAFTPLAMLFSFVLRVATVAQNTVSPAQFTTPGA
jgi:hypothetical protein